MIVVCYAGGPLMTSPPFPPPTSNFSPFTGPPPLIGHQPPPSMGAQYPPPIIYWPYPSPPISPPHQPPALLIMQGTPPPMAPQPPVDMCNLIHSVSEVNERYDSLTISFRSHIGVFRGNSKYIPLADQNFLSCPLWGRKVPKYFFFSKVSPKNKNNKNKKNTPTVCIILILLPRWGKRPFLVFEGGGNNGLFQKLIFTWKTIFR